MREVLALATVCDKSQSCKGCSGDHETVMFFNVYANRDFFKKMQLSKLLLLYEFRLYDTYPNIAPDQKGYFRCIVEYRLQYREGGCELSKFNSAAPLEAKCVYFRGGYGDTQDRSSLLPPSWRSRVSSSTRRTRHKKGTSEQFQLGGG